MGVSFRWLGKTATINRLTKSNKVGLYVANTCKKHFDPFVPYDQGIMASNTTIKPFSVTYNQPYSKFQYKGLLMLSPSGSSYAKAGEVKHVVSIKLNFSKQQHTNASAEWDQAAYKKSNKKIANEIASLISKGV